VVYTYIAGRLRSREFQIQASPEGDKGKFVESLLKGKELGMVACVC
jgi:hypothetical protein